MIKGFVNQSGVGNASLVGDVWKFEYVPASLRWEMKIHPKFFPPTSNTYNFDYVFDLSNCFSYVGMTPVPTSINFGLMLIPDEQSWRLGTEPSLPGDPTTAVNLTPLAGYWLPI